MGAGTPGAPGAGLMVRGEEGIITVSLWDAQIRTPAQISTVASAAAATTRSTDENVYVRGDPTVGAASLRKITPPRATIATTGRACKARKIVDDSIVIAQKACSIHK